MSYRITNRTSSTVLLRLRSGQTLHLAAGAKTDALDGAEIHGSPRIASLVQRNLVLIEGGSDSATGSGRGPRAKTAGRSSPESAEATAKKPSDKVQAGDSR